MMYTKLKKITLLKKIYNKIRDVNTAMACNNLKNIMSLSNNGIKKAEVDIFYFGK